MKFEVHLKFEKGRTWPRIEFDGEFRKILNERINENFSLVNYIIESKDDQLVLHYREKNDEETVVGPNGTIEQDQTVEIDSIWVDDIKLDRNIFWHQGQYTPIYRSTFLEHCQQNNIKVDHGPINQLKFWHSGSWRLGWNGDFWNWYQARRRESENNIILPQDVLKLLKPIRDYLK